MYLTNFFHVTKKCRLSKYSLRRTNYFTFPNVLLFTFSFLHCQIQSERTGWETSWKCTVSCVYSSINVALPDSVPCDQFFYTNAKTITPRNVLKGLPFAIWCSYGSRTSRSMIAWELCEGLECLQQMWKKKTLFRTISLDTTSGLDVEQKPIYQYRTASFSI